jgi:hypothetical protein
MARTVLGRAGCSTDESFNGNPRFDAVLAVPRRSVNVAVLIFFWSSMALGENQLEMRRDLQVGD